MDYMERWVNHDDFDDFAIMFNGGDVELFASALVSAGAICSSNCCPEAKQIEKRIEVLSKRFRRLSQKEIKKRYDAVFNGVFISHCQKCDHVYFLNDGNEEIYPELKTRCWECKGSNMKTSVWGKK